MSACFGERAPGLALSLWRASLLTEIRQSDRLGAVLRGGDVPVQGKQILLIAPAQRFEVELMLRGLGMEVRSVANPAAAVEIASREDFDMALIDVALTGEGGEGIVARLRAQTAIPSILVITTENAVRRAVRALEYGADDYLVRPLERAEVR